MTIATFAERAAAHPDIVSGPGKVGVTTTSATAADDSSEKKKFHGPSPIPIEILPHKKAPILSSPEGRDIFRDVLRLATSPNLPTNNEEIRQLLREAGFVSLWFFLRVIAAHNGPYERLTNHLHVDMANHYQKFLYPGSWSAFFLPRSAFKSTLVTSGGNGWELLRNEDLTIAMGSSITDRALDFQHETQRIFDDNELFAWLYPEYVPEKGQRSWNDKEFTLPNRTRRKRAPSMETIAVGASSQGIHAELLKLDDIVGDAQLNSERGANADMRRIGNWFKSNKRTLLDNPERDRIVAVGTRYSIEDPWEQIMDSIRGKFGSGWEDIPRDESPDGEWNVYYRQAVENGKAIFPESISIETLDKMRQDDPWNYLTQYRNNPYTQETAELSQYEPEEAHIDYRNDIDSWVVGFEMYHEAPVEFPLSACDVVIAVDPAATEKNAVTVKSSRSALVVVVTTPDGRWVVADGAADYVPISTVFEWMFDRHRRWKPRVISLEQNGPFKILRSMVLEEQRRRKQWIGVVPAKGVGDKDARIRAELEPRLRDGRLYLTAKIKKLFMEELVAFPSGWKKDFLDATAQALMKSTVPPSVEELEEEEEIEEVASLARSRYTGY